MTFMPTFSEQTAIGSFFRTLDAAITLHQRKLDGLRELKKGYLQQMFPQAGERVPRVRFAGFSEEWQERRLGEISTKVSEKNRENQFTETFTNSAEYGIISQRDFFDKDISNSKNLDGYFIVKPDNFVYNPRISNYAPVGPIKRNRLGRTGVMSPLYYVFHITEGDLYFFEKYFESVYWHEFMKMNGDNGVRSDRFNIKDSIFEEMPLPYPCVAEQTAIGDFFRILDERINSQQTKLSRLKDLKSAYLSKMFI
jgi:type I restriction enzyme S subunit